MSPQNLNQSSGPDLTKLSPSAMVLIPLAAILLAVVIYFSVADWGLVLVGDTFHDRMVHRLERIERRWPTAAPILEIAIPRLNEFGFQFFRFDVESPAISDHNKAYFTNWTNCTGMVDWNEKSVIIRMEESSQKMIALGWDDGTFLDILLLHEMVHVAYGVDEFQRPSLSQAEEQLHICLDESKYPPGWKLFENSLVEELVAYLASEVIAVDGGGRNNLLRPGDLANPATLWGSRYNELLKNLVPECFSRVFHKSVVELSLNYTDEEAEILFGRVERFRNSEGLRKRVEKGLHRFGLLAASSVQP